MLKYIFWFIVFFVFAPANSYSTDINGLYSPMEIESELLEPPKVEGMVFVKGGCFEMGDTFGDGNNFEKPVHEVCVDDFYIGSYEVTQDEWKVMMGNNPSYFKGCGKCPVERVSWNDVPKYIKKLNRKSGRHYRLPTEAEWEYAAREGGKRVRFGTGKNIIGPDEANFNAIVGFKKSYSRIGVFRKKTKLVGSFAPNALGVYDMSGNVAEWVSDRIDSSYYNYRKSPRNNPKGPQNGKYRVVRGGSWLFGPGNVRAAYRNGYPLDFFNSDVGFRLYLSPQN